MMRPLAVLTTPEQPLTILLAGLKGGVGKSTSAWCMSWELSRRTHPGTGRPWRVLAVDADPISQTLADSHTSAIHRHINVPFDVISLPTVETFLPHLDEAVQFHPVDAIIVDTGGDYRGPFDLAAQLADEVIATAAPTENDLRRLEPTRQAVERAALLSRRDPGFAVLLVRTQSRAADARRAREFLEGTGWPVMESQVPDAAEYRRVFGYEPNPGGAYELVVDELLAGRAADQEEARVQ